MDEKRRDIIDKILRNEGSGWHSEGSYRGIMPQTYQEFMEKTGCTVPHEALPSRLETVYAFYEWYLEKYHTWDLPAYLHYIHADFATNAGKAAIRIIQRIVSTDVDGVWGPKTECAVTEFFSGDRSDDELIDFYDAEKRKHYHHLAQANPEKYQKYLHGWLSRCDRVLKDLAATDVGATDTQLSNSEEETT